MVDERLQGAGGDRQLPDEEDAAMGDTGQDSQLRDMTVSTDRFGDLADPGLSGPSLRDERRVRDARTRQERATDSQLPDEEDAAMGDTGQDSQLRDMTVSTDRFGDLADPGLSGPSLRDERRVRDARTRQERATDSVAARTGLDPGTDFSVNPEPVPDGRLRTNPDAGGLEVSLTAEGEQELSARRVEEQGGFETEDGQFVEAETTPEPVPDALARTNPRAGGREVSLTPAGRSDLIVDRVEEQGGVETQDGDLIEADPTDLQFDSEGRLSGIDRDSGGGGIGATIAAGADDVAGFVGGAAGSVPGTGVVANVTDATLDVGGDALSATANAPGVTQTLSGVRTAGDAIGDVSADAAAGARDFVDTKFLEPSSEVSTLTNAQRSFGQGLLTGAASLAGVPAAVAGGVATAEDAFQGAQANVREEGVIGGSLESTGVAVGVGGAAAAGTAKAAAQNPAGFGGQLAGSSLAAAGGVRALGRAGDRAPVATPTGGVFSAGEARGVTVGLNRTSGKVEDVQPLVTVSSGTRGRTPVELGTPDLDLDRVVGRGDGDGPSTIEPQLGGAETRALTETLRDEGFDQSAERIEAGRAVQRETQRADLQPEEAAPVIEDVLERQELDAEFSEDITATIREQDAKLKGSIVQDVAGSQVDQPGVGRVPRDIDVVAPNPKSFADEIDRRMGDAVDVDGTDVTAPSGEKLFDILEEGQFDPEQRGRLGSGTGQEGDTIAFGLREEDPVFTDEAVETTTLSDQTARKLQGALKETGATERQVGDVSGAVTPRQPGRVKDIPDFFIGERANIAKLELQGDDARAARAREELDRFLGAFDDDIGQRARREFRQAADEDGVEVTFGAKTDGGDATPDVDAPASTIGTTTAARADGEVASPPPAGGDGSPLSSPSAADADNAEIGAVESASAGVNPGGSTPRPPSQMADESPSPSPSSSDTDSPVPSASPPPGEGPESSAVPVGSESPAPGFGSESPSPGFGSESPSPGFGSESPSPGFGSESPSPGFGSESPSPAVSDSSVEDSYVSSIPTPNENTSSPLSPPPGPSPPPGDPGRPRLPEDTDDEREDELLFASGAVGERFVNPIRRLGTGADPDVGEPPQLADQPAYDEVADPPDAYGGGR